MIVEQIWWLHSVTHNSGKGTSWKGFCGCAKLVVSTETGDPAWHHARIFLVFVYQQTYVMFISYSAHHDRPNIPFEISFWRHTESDYLKQTLYVNNFKNIWIKCMYKLWSDMLPLMHLPACMCKMAIESMQTYASALNEFWIQWLACDDITGMNNDVCDFINTIPPSSFWTN